MNTILITGTAKQKADLSDPQTISFDVLYDVNIWGNKDGEDLQLITSIKERLSGYSQLWEVATKRAISYLGNDTKLDDGAYTRFLDHLILL